MLLRRVLVALVLEVLQRGDEFASRLAWTNDLIDEASARRDVRVGELLAELLHFLCSLQDKEQVKNPTENAGAGAPRRVAAGDMALRKW